jgi:hypothetical protein
MTSERDLHAMRGARFGYFTRSVSGKATKPVPSIHVAAVLGVHAVRAARAVVPTTLDGRTVRRSLRPFAVADQDSFVRAPPHQQGHPRVQVQAPVGAVGERSVAESAAARP